jgi:hypothetical protein
MFGGGIVRAGRPTSHYNGQLTGQEQYFALHCLTLRSVGSTGLAAVHTLVYLAAKPTTVSKNPAKCIIGLSSRSGLVMEAPTCSPLNHHIAHGNGWRAT